MPRIVRWFAWTLGLLLCLMVLATLLINTPPGKRYLASRLSELLSRSPRINFQIDGLRGTVPTSMHIDSIQIRDAEGTFLVVNDATIRWSLASVLRPPIHLYEVSVKRVDVQRRPPPDPDARPLDTVRFFPSLLRKARVDQITIEQLSVSQAVAGQDAVFRASGQLTGRSLEELSGALEVERTDQPTTRANLNLTLGGTSALGLALDLEDSAFIPKALGLNDAKAFAVTLEGAGDSEEWIGALTGTLGAEPFLDSEVMLAVGDTIGGSAKGTVKLDRFPRAGAIVDRLGADAKFYVEGERRRDGSFRIANLEAEGAGTTLQGRTTYDKNAATIDAEARVQAESLATVVGQSVEGLQQAASVTLSLKGPVERPKAGLSLRLSEQRALEVTGDLDLREGYGFDLDLHAWPIPPLVSKPIGDAFKDGLEGRLTGLRRTDGSFDLTECTLRAAGAELRGDGLIDLASETLEGTVSLVSLDLEALHGLLPPGTEGVVLLTGHVAGTTDAWQAEVDVDARNLKIGGVTAPATVLTLTCNGGAWRPFRFEGVTVRGNARATSVTVQSVTQPEVHLTLAANFKDEEHIRLENLSIQSRDVDLGGLGDYRIASKDGNFGVQVALNNLAILSSGIQGTASLSAVLRTNTSKPLMADITGSVSSLAGLPDAALALATDRLDLAGTLELSPESTLRLEKVALTSPNLSAKADGSVDLREETVAGEVQIGIPDLTVLSAAAGRTLSGSAEGTGVLYGPWDNLAARIDLVGKALGMETAKVDLAKVTADIRNFPEKPEGSAEATLRSGPDTLTTGLSFAVDRPQVHIPEMRLQAGSNAVTGHFNFDTASQKGEGALQGDLNDLALVGRLLGVDLSGSATMNLRLEPDTARLTAELKGNGLSFEGSQLETLSVTTVVANPMGAASGSAALEMRGIDAGPVQVDQVVLRAEGDRDDATITAEASGGVFENAPFAGQAEMAIATSQFRYAMTKLGATVGEHQLLLVEPAVLELGPDRIVLGPTTVTIDNGNLRLAAERTSETVRVSGSFDAVPMDLAQLAGGPALEGVAAGTLELSGSPAEPELHLTSTLRNVRERGATYEPFTMDVTSVLRGGRCGASGTIVMADRVNADVQVKVPVLLSLDPPRVQLLRDGPMEGTCEATADLAVVPVLFDLQDHFLSGTAQANLTLGGTIGAPELSGEACLANGSYENLRTGTILKDIRTVLAGNNREVRIDEFQAVDDAGGMLTAGGRVALLPDDHFPFGADAHLTKLRVANRDALSGLADGNLAIAGNLKHAEVTGALALGPAAVTLPKRRPSDYPELAVTEINGPAAGSTGVTETPAEEAPPMEVSLDVVCDIPGQVYVRSQSLDSEWKGKLRVAGTVRAPRVTGALSSVRGQVTFLDRTFDLKESAITLDGRTPPAPYLDINAQTRTPDLTAALHLFGVYPDVRLELQSEPAFPQDEILARLLFDRNLSEITPFQAVQLAAMAESMRGNDGFSVLSNSSRMLAGFRVQVRRQGEGVGETAVSVGKYLTEKVYVEVEQGLRDQTGQGKVEIQVTPELSVEGKADSEGKGGIGLFYKKDY